MGQKKYTIFPPRLLAELRAIAAETHQRSSVMHEFNAKLALAEGEKLQGKQPSKAALIVLASQARSKGYLLIARKLSSIAAAE